MRQRGGPAPCAHGRADRLSDGSRLARAAAPHSAYRHDVQGGRHSDQAQVGSAEGGGRQEKGEDGARLLSTCVDNGARILYIHLMLNRLCPCDRPAFHYRKQAA